MDSIRANLASRSFDIEVLREELPELLVLVLGQTTQFWERKLRKDSYVIKKAEDTAFSRPKTKLPLSVAKNAKPSSEELRRRDRLSAALGAAQDHSQLHHLGLDSRQCAEHISEPAQDIVRRHEGSWTPMGRLGGLPPILGMKGATDRCYEICFLPFIFVFSNLIARLEQNRVEPEVRTGFI